MTAASAWAQLQAALSTDTPSCAGDARFTSDTADHDDDLLEICWTCPIREQCGAYVRSAPVGQVWGYYAGTPPDAANDSSARPA